LAQAIAPSDAPRAGNLAAQGNALAQAEQEEGEHQYRAVALRFVEMGNSFLRKLAGAGLSELTRMPHALDPEKGFRVRSTFIFEDFIGTAQPHHRCAGSLISFYRLWAHAM